MKAINLAAALTLLAVPATAEETREAAGKALYDQHCATCHQFDGGGVPMLQPELIGKPRANGPVGGVIDVILFGSEALGPMDEDYANEMPAFDFLSDKEIALIATYVRTHFENTGGIVTSDDVEPRRNEQ